jgi:hypothetical protein
MQQQGMPNRFRETRSTAIAVKPRSRVNNVKERRLESEHQEEAKNKFIANVPKLLLKVSLSQFPFSTKISQIFGVNENTLPCDMQNYFESYQIYICSF